MNKHFFLFFLILIPFISKCEDSVFSKYFINKTLNIEVFHYQKSSIEQYEIKDFYATDVFSGNRHNLIDNTNLGVHRIEIYLKNTKKIIYAKNYSSLFAEWITMDEAKKIKKVFEEVIRIPYPKEDVDIVFLSRNEKGIFSIVSKDEIIVSKIKNRNDAKKLYPPLALSLANKDSVDKKLDIVIIPYGYTKKDSLKEINDFYLFTRQFFEKPPFSEKRNDINIWGTMYFSEKTSMDTSIHSNDTSTFLGFSYYTFGSKRYIMSEKLFNIHSIVQNIPYDQIIVMCNSEVYGGGGIFNFYATSYINPNNGFVITHEFGHSFAALADEYDYNDIDVEGAKISIEPFEKNITSLVDFDSKWKDLMDENTPIPTPKTKEYENKVGVFEGAAYVSKGLYRPFQHCLMREDKPFCPVCTRAIEEMLLLYTK
ncbi:MAG: IgA Peptidase M64 [Bacteroidales bacterium]|jgi:hypothetical protein|nr:IgA Peptidase M64 [Bacteroidales bacterium]